VGFIKKTLAPAPPLSNRQDGARVVVVLFEGFGAPMSHREALLLRRKTRARKTECDAGRHERNC